MTCENQWGIDEVIGPELVGGVFDVGKSSNGVENPNTEYARVFITQVRLGLKNGSGGREQCRSDSCHRGTQLRYPTRSGTHSLPGAVSVSENDKRK